MNKVSVPLWQAYLKFCYAHHDAQLSTLFERAIQSVGQLSTSTDIWLMWIDVEMSHLNMAKCNLICWLALKVPLLGLSQIYNK